MSGSDTVADWTTLVHERYPPANAADWDNVGLQVGDPAWPVERVLVSLDVTTAVVEEAADGPPTLVVAHHPVLFRPLSALTPLTAAGRVALAAASAGVAVMAAHTNLDVARDGAGTSQPVADLLELADTRVLAPGLREADEVKLVVFVPPEAVDNVLDALSAAGAGVIGDYERCSFRTRGTGSFRPGSEANPYSGAVGEDASEDEFRLEMVVPRGRIGTVIDALDTAHPYDEVAYDLVPLLTGDRVGLGLVGTLRRSEALESVAARIRQGLPAPHLRYAGQPDREVTTVAVVGGAGGSLLGAARSAGADVCVTADLGHHLALDALELGMAVIDAGHHATEVAALPRLIGHLRDAAEHRGLVSPVLASATSTDPWRSQ